MWLLPYSTGKAPAETSLQTEKKVQLWSEELLCLGPQVQEWSAWQGCKSEILCPKLGFP